MLLQKLLHQQPLINQQWFPSYIQYLQILVFFLLGAFSGLYICAFEVVRDYLYYKSNKDGYIFAFSLPIYGIMGYYSFNTIFDLLPIVSSIIDGFSLKKKRNNSNNIGMRLVMSKKRKKMRYKLKRG